MELSSAAVKSLIGDLKPQTFLKIGQSTVGHTLRSLINVQCTLINFPKKYRPVRS